MKRLKDFIVIIVTYHFLEHLQSFALPVDSKAMKVPTITMGSLSVLKAEFNNISEKGCNAPLAHNLCVKTR